MMIKNNEIYFSYFMLKYNFYDLKIARNIVEINPFVLRLKDLSERGETLRGYL